MSRCILAALVAAAALGSSARSDDNKAPAGFTALFNGKDLSGWKGHTTMGERTKLDPEKLANLQDDRTKTALQQWSVVDGAIHLTPPKKGDPAGVSLVTDKDYGDFELLIDWKIEKNGDSGLYLRGQPQVQIWDSDNSGGARGVDKGSGSGGLWNNPYPPGTDTKDDKATLAAGQKVGKIPLKKADKPVGEWNTFHIVMKGDKVTVKLNGELVVDAATLAAYKPFNDKLPEKGPIELQFHGDPLWFKNIYVKELK
jgi:hypothetical protein